MGPKPANNPKRTPKDNPSLGKIDSPYVPPPVDDPPVMPKYGLCKKPANPSKTPNDGAQMMIRSNYVKVRKVPENLHVYSLTFFRKSREGVRMEYNKRREIRDAFQAMVKADALQLEADGVERVTDFKTLWTTKPINGRDEKDYTFLSQPFAYTQQNGKAIPDMQAEVCYVGHLSDIENALRTQHLASLPEYIRALNANVAQCIENRQATTEKKVIRVGANKFYVSNGYKEMRGLLAGRGYFTSIRPGADTTLLNINPVTSAFLPPVTVSEFIKKIGTDEHARAYASQLLHGATVKIRYQRSNYVGSDVDYNSNAARLKIFTQIGPYYAHQQKFYELADKVEDEPRKTKPTDRGTTVLKYFTDHAKVQFPAGTAQSSPEMYCINVGKRVKTKKMDNSPPEDGLMRSQSAQGALWIPACLLQIIPGQVIKTTLNNMHTSEMIRHALRLSAENVGLLEEEGLDIMGVRAGSDGQQPLVSDLLSDHIHLDPLTAVWTSVGFEVDDELIEVPAIQLPQPKLSYGASSPEKIPKLGSWDLQDVTFAAPAKFKDLWMLTMPNCFGNKKAKVIDVYSALAKRLKAHGLQFEDGLKYDPEGKPTDHSDHIWARDTLFDDEASHDDEETVRKFLNYHVTGPNDCGFILIPEKSYETYAMVKRIADFGGRNILLAVGSKFLQAKPDQFLSNLALKVNIRFGGDNHHFSPADFNKILGLETRKNTIVIGADIAHCGGGGKEGSPSIACLVGSNDSAFMSYPGSMRLQRGGQENIDNDHMYSMIQERLRGWQALYNSTMAKPDYKKWPSNMISFRDGVSESQFQSCIDEEIKTIKRVYKDLCTRDLTLTFVVCGKRHHTRFYATEEKQTYTEKSLNVGGDKIPNGINGNLQPGLLVTDVVTNPIPFNYFLQSHKAIKGTARSAHYHVLEDGMKLGQKRLPELTMMLCYAFGRATTGVSYAAPAYLADRLCERGRVYLRAWNLDPEMKPTLNIPVEKDEKGKQKRPTQETIDEAKKVLAHDISTTESIWGKHYGTKPPTLDGRTWLNPWNPSLLDRASMFWM